MEIDLKVYCEECNNALGENDKIYCEGCFMELQERIGELTGQIEEKDRAIAELEIEISSIKTGE